MKLIFNQYLETEPDAVHDRLETAVVTGIDAAARRIDAHRNDLTTEPVQDGLTVHGGLDVLDGCELRVTGTDGLTVLEFEVPWSPAGKAEPKLLAANAFAHTVAREVDAAA